MRKLYISGLSPFARVIRILLHELGLEIETDRLDRLRPEAFSALNPCIAVPVLEDGGRVLFDTKVISAWLLETYTPATSVEPAFTGVAHGEDKWEDLEITAAIETLLETIVSLFLYGRDAAEAGLEFDRVAYVDRQRSRADSILSWLEARFTREGRQPGAFTVQDIWLIAALDFIAARDFHPLGQRPNLFSTQSHFKGRPSLRETAPG